MFSSKGCLTIMYLYKFQLVLSIPCAFPRFQQVFYSCTASLSAATGNGTSQFLKTTRNWSYEVVLGAISWAAFVLPVPPKTFYAPFVYRCVSQRQLVAARFRRICPRVYQELCPASRLYDSLSRISNHSGGYDRSARHGIPFSS